MLEGKELSRAKYLYRQQRKYVSGRIDKLNNPIEFNITFDDWIKIWLDSGKWDLRGSGKGSYCMARYNDIGHYTKYNVFITSTEENSSAGSRKIIITPKGTFESRTMAAKAYRISPQAMGYLAKTNPNFNYSCPHIQLK